MYSLFEEQISGESQQIDHFLSYGTDSFAEALSYFPDLENFKVGPDEYLERIRNAVEAVDIPIIGSLNGVSSGGWVEFSSRIEEAGASALELNVYYIPTNPDMTSEEVENMYVEVVRDVAGCVSIPIAVKLSPFFSSPANVARKLAAAGANGLVLFNRFYQPDIDLEHLEVVPHLVLSRSDELRLPLRWVAILYGRIEADLAVTSGVHTHTDALKAVMAGANVTMIASALLENGIGRITEILDDMKLWMDEHHYESVAQMRGSMSQKNVAEPAAFERANYMKVLQSWREDPTGQMMF
jgi:dihydroorotate dehydrogenase (fumarate)